MAVTSGWNWTGAVFRLPTASETTPWSLLARSLHVCIDPVLALLPDFQRGFVIHGHPNAHTMASVEKAIPAFGNVQRWC